MSDVDRKAKGSGSTRIRTRIYGERQAVTVRMSEELNTRLMAFCDRVRSPANSHIIELLKEVVDLGQPIKLGRAPPRGGRKITVTVRLEPELHRRLMHFCTRQNVSANWLALFLIERDLARKQNASRSDQPTT